ncbi:VWA domain-containing protein [uncultured Paraglaciecola sp.]|uniref:vWA domain-containing protein n=1 Tax=uncultured Paraglaciecola sp. TaxID=1765024 RepID=UPI002625220A|nr:VWA domain-containing protein [uncultured Paraglaciecola sp.]
MRFVGDFIGALREAGLPISPAESLDALNAIKLTGLSQRERSKTVLALTLVKRQADTDTYEELFDLYFGNSETLNEEQENNSESSSNPNEISQSQSAAANQSNAKSSEAEPSLNSENASGDASSTLGKALGQGADMSLDIVQAASAEKLSSIVLFTQKNYFAYKIMQRLGDAELSAEIRTEPADLAQKHLKKRLTQARAQLQEQVKDYVEQQYMIFARNKGQKYRVEHLQQIKLGQLEARDYKLMQRLVQRAARKLASQHGRRRLTRKRGQLDVRKTIAANAAFDGALFHTRWKATRVERPKVLAICDVSGSVSRVARFLLLFLYSLQDVLPKVSSFVFASQMIDVSELFKQQSMEIALDEIMQRWAGMPTDYGKAFEGLQSQALANIDKRTTVILLGDARNNNGDGRVDIWEKVYRKSKRVLWLNPERQSLWDTGDSIMSEYSPWCGSVETCRNLKDIERIFSRVLKYS